MIKGIGTDILDIKRFERIHLTWGDKLINKLFNIDEVPSCSSNKKFIQSLAGKFAAKEAIMKALKSSGVGDPISFESIEILSSKTGEPIVVIDIKFSGQCKVSISHTNSHAIASAIYTLE